MRLKMIKAVIFDMDGLMINSEEVTFEGYKLILKKMNLTITRDFYKTLLGKPVPEIYSLFYHTYGNDFPIESVIKEVHDYMSNLFKTEGVPLKSGLIELLDYLKANNYKTIVATSSTRKRVDEILSIAKITDYFDASICGDEVSKGKPNPEVFLKSCAKLKVKPDEAIVLEDSEAGIQASYTAGIKVYCIPDMKEPGPEYQKMATAIVPNLGSVIDILKNHR